MIHIDEKDFNYYFSNYDEESRKLYGRDFLGDFTSLGCRKFMLIRDVEQLRSEIKLGHPVSNYAVTFFSYSPKDGYDASMINAMAAFDSKVEEISKELYDIDTKMNYILASIGALSSQKNSGIYQMVLSLRFIENADRASILSTVNDQLHTSYSLNYMDKLISKGCSMIYVPQRYREEYESWYDVD